MAILIWPTLWFAAGECVEMLRGDQGHGIDER